MFGAGSKLREEWFEHCAAICRLALQHSLLPHAVRKHTVLYLVARRLVAEEPPAIRCSSTVYRGNARMNVAGDPTTSFYD